MTVIKICGITRLEDALLCTDHGVELLGFNFYPGSPRCVAPETCAEIINQLAKRNKKPVCVGVFVNLPAMQIEQIMNKCGLDVAQLHGDETPTAVASLKIPNYKAFRGLPLPENSDEYPQPDQPNLPQILVDAAIKGQYGGTGAMLDWRTAAENFPINKRLLLAGGITPANAKLAIELSSPWGIDLASGVESAPGIKDPAMVAKLVAEARAANSNNG